MLRCWAEPAEGITAVEVEAAGAPHVDDIIVHGRDRVFFKQLKHTVEEKGRVTGADLFSEQGGGTSLMGKLFRGWNTVRTRKGPSVEVHLTTNAIPSADSRNQLISPVEFQRHVLLPARSGTWTCPDELQPVLKRIQDLTGAPDQATVIDFLSALRLEFGEPSEDELRRYAIELLRNHLRPDTTVEIEADAWTAKVYELSTRHSETGLLSRSDIDRELRRLFGAARPLVEHRLALPDHHVPRPSIVDTILDAAHDLGTGYLRVLGPPGCGKTTLATWISNEHDDKLLMRYHVFDPRRASGLQRQGRASALEFVRTMFDVLAQRFPGVATPYVPAEDTLPNAVAALGEELGRLAGDRPSILVIDGIDHVVRSGVKSGSLFEALPQPPPPNVVFVLFGQPDWEYPSWLDRARHVPIPPFTEPETRSHVCGRMGWSLSDTGAAAVADYLYEKSKGNPLSLFYNLSVIERLGKTPEEVSAYLRNITLFGGVPHEEYDRLLDDLEKRLPAPQGSKSLRRELLACLAVAAAAVTEERLCSAFAEDGLTLRQARDYLSGLRPVVAERRTGCYWLFHDDFRRYAEESTSLSERSAAHRRLARALDLDWRKEELAAWAEHLWLGNEDARLAGLPCERSLEQWFQSAPQRAVVTMHRLALAAAFRIGEDIGILRNALAAERAAEAADLPSVDMDDVPPELGLKGWSFVVPPKGVDSRSLQRRASALQAAATGCEKDQLLAAEIADRFLIPEELIPDSDEQTDYETRSYISALARWRLFSGDLEGAKRVAENERFSSMATPALSGDFVIETKADVLAVWADALVGVSEWLDREITKAALLHLAEGREQCALSIARALAGCSSTTAETLRDAAVLLSLIEGDNLTDTKDLEARVRWNEGETTRPGEWREFFFDGFVVAASGPVLDLGLHRFPLRFIDAMSRRHSGESDIRLATFLWRCGCAAGLACRGPDLLTPQEFERLLLVLTGNESLQLEPFQRYTFPGFTKVYLPLILLAVRSRHALAAKARELLVPVARERFATPGDQTYGLLEATWLIDPEAWRSIAKDAQGVRHLPGTEATERVGWFSYWATWGIKRNVKSSEEFLAKSSIAALGVPRKTDPARLAVDLLCDTNAGFVDTVVGVRQLVDLLIRLDAEPEGGRAAHRQLPRVLGLAFREQPFLFWSEFLRSTVEYSVAEPFGAVPAAIVIQWLEVNEAATVAELLASWYWLAACPGGFGDEGGAAEAGRMIIQKLKELSARGEAARVERWYAALAVREQEESPSTQVSNLDTGTDPGNHSNTPEAAETSVVGEESSEPESPKRLKPDISEVTSRWFAPWWSRSEHQVLRQYLSQGGDEAWRWVCGRIAEQIATTEYQAYDANLIAEGLVELRPCVLSGEAFEIATQHLAEKVRFQKEPSPRETTSDSGLGRLEVLVSLTARGIDISDVETLRRSLRSVAALARNPATAPMAEREMLARLRSNEPRTLIYALIILRQITELTQETHDRIRVFKDHPDIWCRWLACNILKVVPNWPELRSLTTAPGLISPAVQPTHSELGLAYYADTTSVREIFLQKFGSLMKVDEDELRSWLEIELRDLPPLEERSSGWHNHQPGPTLTATRVGEAAGRLACRLASTAPPPALPALMSIAARQDPWFVIAEPVVEAPDDWIEVCQCRSGPANNREEYLLRSIGLVHRDHLSGDDPWPPEMLASVGSRLLFPRAPEQFAWVAEPWPVMASPRMERGPVVPLSFFNSLFTELVRDRFMLIPRWDLPPFRDLRFEVGEAPAWVHPELGPVLVGTYRERLMEKGGAKHPTAVWWAGWYAAPSWLETFVQPNTALIRFWRLEWRERLWGETKGASKVEFGMQDDVMLPN